MTFENRKTKYQVREELKRKIEANKGWYFITFAREFPTHRPYGFTLFNKPFVLLQNSNNDLVCYSLASVNSEKYNIKLQSFNVEKRQDEIWFWHG